MFLATFEPGQEMALANLFLAIFCLFTISLPLLLVTRGDKTEANRNFIAATVNPWFQINNEIELTPVVVSRITPTIELEPKLEVYSKNIDEQILESERVISIEIRKSEELEESSTEVLKTNSDLLAA